MKYKHEIKDSVCIIRFSGKIMGGPDFEKFHTHVKELVAEDHPAFLFNLEKVDWINSTGIGILMSAYNSIKTAERRFALCGANQRVSNVYYVLQLDKIFDTFDDCGEALAKLTE